MTVDGVSPELLELVAKVRANLKVASGQMREVERALALLPQESAAPAIECPHCGPLAAVRSPERLAEHLENVHGRQEAQESGAPIYVAIRGREGGTLARIFPDSENESTTAA